MTTSAPLNKLSSIRVFDGLLSRYEHASSVLGDQLPMKFAVFVPDGPRPVRGTLFYLSGLTCTDENVSQKGATAFKALSETGLAMVMPDTSPRGHPEIPTENDAFDFGTGAGFYLDATKKPWSQHYKMYSYVVQELPQVLTSAFGGDWGFSASKMSITGHSMGGHGAMTIALKNPSLYRSVSAFAPICNPSQVPWGKKAFGGYLEDPATEAKSYDTVELLAQGKTHPAPLLVDQGTADGFYSGEVNQLQPAALEKACAEAGQALQLQLREGYDHSYWFISTFIEDHVRFHAKYLCV